MKSLNEYVNESLLDDEKHIVNDDKSIIIKQIKSFAKKYLDLEEHEYTVTDNLELITEYPVDLRLTEEIIKNGIPDYIKLKQTGAFSFQKTTKTTINTLEGLCPEAVIGEFRIYNLNIKNLIGSPKYIINSKDDMSWPAIKIENCNELESLDGISKMDDNIYANCEVVNCKKLKDISAMKINNCKFTIYGRNSLFNIPEGYELSESTKIIFNK